MQLVKILEKAKSHTMENKLAKWIEGMHSLSFYMDGEYFLIIKRHRYIIFASIKESNDLKMDAKKLVDKLAKNTQNRGLSDLLTQKLKGE